MIFSNLSLDEMVKDEAATHPDRKVAARLYRLAYEDHRSYQKHAARYDASRRYIPIPAPDIRNALPLLPIMRVPSHHLGPGVLGCCYTGTTIIMIRDDIFGELFDMVDSHETKHYLNGLRRENDVDFWTRAERTERYLY